MSHEDADKRAAEAYVNGRWSLKPDPAHKRMVDCYLAGRQSLAAKVEALERVAEAAEKFKNYNPANERHPHSAEHYCHLSQELGLALAALKSLEGKEGERG